MGPSPLDRAFLYGSLLTDCNSIGRSPIPFVYAFSGLVSILHIFTLCNPPRTLSLFACCGCVVLYLQTPACGLFQTAPLGHVGPSAGNRNGCLPADAELHICTRGQLMKKEMDFSGKKWLARILSAATCSRDVCVLFLKFLSVVEPARQPPASYVRLGGDLLRESGAFVII